MCLIFWDYIEHACTIVQDHDVFIQFKIYFLPLICSSCMYVIADETINIF
jgi:hypothetical protein